MSLAQNIKAAYGTTDEAADRGGVVEFILIVAGIAVVTLLAVNWIGSAVLNKGADIAECIEGSNTYNASGSAETCQNANHSAQNSYKNDNGYKGRYGN